mgnify:CR=1 FL=1
MPATSSTVSPAAAVQTKYAFVAADLAEKIRQGTYRPGDLLPSEPELTRYFGVSRHTVRAALRSLSDRGLIVSQRGRGSIVQDAVVTPRYTQACDSIEDVLQYAQSTRREIVSRRRFVDRKSVVKGKSVGMGGGRGVTQIRTTE